MLPPFDIEGGLALALTRFAADTGLVALSGATIYQTMLVPAALSAPARTQLQRWTWLCLFTAFAGGAAWLLAETCYLATDLALSDIAAVLRTTQFGHLLLFRAVMLTLCAGAIGARFGRAACMLSLLALLSQAGNSHAQAMFGPSLLLASDIMHLAAAAIWLGALMPLLLVIRIDPASAQAASRRFSPVAMLCVAAIVMTAAVQGFFLIGTVPGAIGTGYGWLAILKILGLILLLCLAARNRWHYTPALGRAGHAMTGLYRSIAAETGIGLVIMAAAATLSQMQPAMHLQPIWPLPVVVSLDAAREDPDLMREALGGAAALLLGLIAAAAILAPMLLHKRTYRVWRVGVAVVGLSVALVGGSHLRFLLVPAYPTQFYHTQTGFSAASITQGQGLYPANCAACHGPDGRGNGPAAASLAIPPANLTAAHLWMHADGELFWWLSHGIEAPDGGLAMPGFAATLPDQDIWSLIDYVRAHNAGLTLQNGHWGTQLRAPDFQATCQHGPISLSDLRGTIVRIVIGPAQAIRGATTLAITGGLAPGLCTAAAADFVPAYAVASGLDKAHMDNTIFLIDQNGWLRAMSVPGGQPDLRDPNALAAAIADIKAHPMVPAAPSAMPMNMPM